MKADLLTSLRRYNVTDKRDPIENFLTEAFAWLLSSHDDFASFFLGQITEALQIKMEVPHKKSWSTQKNFSGFFPDMICEFEKGCFVFEHKVWAHLHDDQLSNYRVYAEKNYDFSCLILITGHEKQHDQDPDLALCWHNVYKYIDGWLEGKEGKDYFMFESFQNLLVQEGLGPSAPISHNSILSYYSAFSLVDNTIKLVSSVFNNEKKVFDSIFGDQESYELQDDGSKYGRIGLSMFKVWSPGVFVGFLINGKDHCTTSLLGERSPDFSVILSFDKKFHNTYLDYENYNLFVKYLEDEIHVLGDGWNLYHHVLDKNVSSANKWHPIHIRKPMIELLQGTITTQDQSKRFVDASRTILGIIKKSESFYAMKKEYTMMLKSD